ncbi:MAG: type IV pilus assembly protein PilM [Fimbriimonadaceae bacterium]|nr:type IV pilus assembly protein PilM [Chthonomonadaceae bacterium]MCO5296535.1 type IV pilus assembly protein PilM [Fimbriimonadaceae bacterium]
MPRDPSSRFQRRSLGIDVGSQAIKFVAADLVAERVDVQTAGSFTIPLGLVTDGIVRDPKRFGRSVRAQLLEAEVACTSTVFSVPSNLAVLRWLNMPLLEPDELREAARFKVKRHLPFPVEDAYVEASPPESVDEEGQGPALIIAVRRDVVDSRAEGLECAGLEPIGAELEAQAILRVAERRLGEQSALWRDASLTIIDVGATNTHMYVVQNQQLQFIRGVKFGANLISQTVADALDLATEEADALLSRPETVLNPDGVLHLCVEGLPACMRIQPALERLTREFLRLLRYFRSLHPERSYAGILDHVLVCGGLASLNGFAEYLEQELGLRVERARPFAGTIAKFSKSSFENVVNRQEAYTVVMGLALSGLESTRKDQGEAGLGHQFAWSRAA